MIFETHDDLRKGLDRLCKQDPGLGRLRSEYGDPPLWKRQESFATLLHIILEQQVSLDSARATFERVSTKLAGEVAPRQFLQLSDEELRACAFSRQKARYGRELARAIERGELVLEALRVSSDNEVFGSLTSIIGIGQWTADIYRLMAMGRPDIWPLGDIALAQALREVFALEERPSNDEQVELVERWRPFRSVAARLLWLKYLKDRRRAAEEFPA